MLMKPRTTMQLMRRCRLYHGGIASTAATTSSSSSATTQIAAWIFADSPLLTEAIATLSYDAIIIDNQHGIGDVLPMLQAIASGRQRSGATAKAFVRVSENRDAEISRALDCGADGLICPMVNSEEEAKAFVSAARYPPMGGRSFGPHRALLGSSSAHASHGDWTRAENARILLYAMIETREALGELDAILEVGGLDGVFIGPNDLGMRLGHDPTSSPEGAVLQTIEHVIERAHAHGKLAGIYCGDATTAWRMARSGMDLVVAGGELGWVVGGAAAALEVARS